MAGWFKKLLGDRGERLAAKFLRKRGFKIIARQYKTRMGELDLIARDGHDIVFVEVKTRRSDAAGHPVEAITPTKQQKLTRLALDNDAQIPKSQNVVKGPCWALRIAMLPAPSPDVFARSDNANTSRRLKFQEETGNNNTLIGHLRFT